MTCENRVKMSVIGFVRFSVLRFQDRFVVVVIVNFERSPISVMRREKGYEISGQMRWYGKESGERRFESLSARFYMTKC